jgi:hypothetical protein
MGGWPTSDYGSRSLASMVDRRRDFGSSLLNERQRFRKRGFVAVVKLDVVGA